MDQIKQATEKFTSDITKLISEAAIASVVSALAPEGRTSIPAEEIFGQPKPKTNGATNGVKAHAKKGGAKRDPAVIDKLTESLYAAIAKAPCRGVEQLSRELKTQTKDLALPVQRLLTAKRVVTKGIKRATRYFPRKK
jgi:hypothetical protein